MTTLRSMLYMFGKIVSIVIYLPVTLISALFPPLTGNRIISQWAHFNRWWLRVTCNLDCEVTGLSNLPRSPSVILSKHQSAWETIVYQTFLPPMCFVIKRELLFIPVFGWGLAAAHPIAINRADGRRALDAVLTKGRDRLDKGLWVCVFPEGTRTAPGERVKHNAGGAMLAAKTGVEIVPIAHNAGIFWKKNGFTKKPGMIQVEIGPTIQTDGRKVREIAAEAEDWIERRSLALAGTHGIALDSAEAS